MKRKHIGSDFDEFLAEEGILAEVEIAAVKRALASQIASLMKQEGLGKSAMARRMRTSRPALDRLLDPNNGSVTLRTLERAARVLGRKVHIALV